MRCALKLHPGSPSLAATHVEIAVSRPRAGNLVLRYNVTGNIDDLRLASVVAAARADALWRHTCFEAFLRAVPEAGYYEFNFAPSTQWAAYRFSGYRSAMCIATEIDAPRIAVQSAPACYTLQASLELDRLPASASPWRLGLSAVIEDANGNRSYWALAHPPGKPDFHHADCFALEVCVLG